MTNEQIEKGSKLQKSIEHNQNELDLVKAALKKPKTGNERDFRIGYCADSGRATSFMLPDSIAATALLLSEAHYSKRILDLQEEFKEL